MLPKIQEFDNFDLLIGWINHNCTDDYWNTDAPTTGRSIDVDSLISTINDIRKDPRIVIDEGKNDGWFK
jgi:hypothetical protein